MMLKKTCNVMGHNLARTGVLLVLMAMIGCAHSEASHQSASANADTDQLDSNSLVELGEQYASRPPEDLNHAAALFRKAAEQGNAKGALLLGESYADGKGVPKDIDQAAIWYRKAADKGNIQARTNLRLMFYLGEVNPVDVPGAGQWWRDLVQEAAREKQAFAQTSEAANQGNVDAMIQLGIDYLTGVGTSRNPARAKAEFQQAAQHQRVDAQCLFDIVSSADVEQGQTVHQCLDAATQGSAVSQFAVSYMYRNARFGVPRDLKQMIDWERKAADQGFVDAQYWLGRDYGGGYGTPKDYKQAEFWYQKAANQGSYKAMGMLALLAFEAHDPRFAQFAFTDPLGDPELAQKYEDLSSEHRADLVRDLMPNLFASSEPRRWGMP
jgi:TPR repeat protein